MNHTVIVDEDCRDRRFTNMFNALFRHCRIVNVKPKDRIEAVPVLPIQIIPQFNEIPQLQWWEAPAYLNGPSIHQRKCSCKPGAACGNAACPHMPIVTC